MVFQDLVHPLHLNIELLLITIMYIVELHAAMEQVREKLAERDKAADPTKLRAMVCGYTDDDRMHIQALELIQGLLEERRLTSSTTKTARKDVELVQKVRDKLTDVVMAGAAVVQEQLVAGNHKIVEAAEYVRSCGMSSCDFRCNVSIYFVFPVDGMSKYIMFGCRSTE